MTRTTIVRLATALSDPALRAALGLAAIFAAVKLVLHIATNIWQVHLGYGIFRDELYYIVCGQHLAWGYVDQGPVVAVQARLASAIFGDSLAGLRMFSALAGAAKIGLTGVLAWSLGGRRPAQALAMLGVLFAPVYLGLDSFLSMNSFEPVFWMGCMLAIIQLAKEASSNDCVASENQYDPPGFQARSPQRWWLLFGLLGGIGLLNKPSMVFFLAALLIGLLLTPQRRLLANKYALAAVALVLLIALPNLLWQVHNHWPTWEFLRNGELHNKTVKLRPVAFILQQISSLHPLNAFIWVPGLYFLLRSPKAKNLRWVGLAYLVFLALMIKLHAKDYYLAPVYPVLFAAGGLAWESAFSRSRSVLRESLFAFPIFETLLAVAGIITLPMALPVMRPQTWVSYTAAMHLRSQSTENDEQGPLPQFYADRFGWQQLADDVNRIYRSLPPQERARAGIYCSNYGEASAINILGASYHLPFAISGHNNYYLWGPHGETGEVMIVVSGDTPDQVRRYYSSVEIAGRMDNPFAMPYEHRNIYLVRGLKSPVFASWSGLKHYI